MPNILVTNLAFPGISSLTSGASVVVLTGHSSGIQTTDPPFLLSDNKVAYNFLSAATAMTVVSTSASDSASGAGARLIVIDGLDGNYTEVTQVVSMNGTTPVALSTNLMFVNGAQVISSGSEHTNVGDISIKAGDNVQGFIQNGIGIQRQLLYTVPAGKALALSNFYVNANNATLAASCVTAIFMGRLQDGTEFKPQTNRFTANASGLSITLPVGFLVPEKVSLFVRISAVSVNGSAFITSSNGILAPV